MAVTARQQPDFRTISDVRKRHLSALSGLFTHVRQLCQQAGVVTLGHVALDGMKIRASTSKHTAMSYGWMQTAEPELAAAVARWLAEATASDVCEDAAYGVDRRGDELPTWVTHKLPCVGKIRTAQTALGAEAAMRARTELAPSDRPRRGRPAKHLPGTSPDRAQRHFTDPDSRIMKAWDGFIQEYPPSSHRCRASGNRGAGVDAPGERRAPIQADAGAQQREHGPTGAGGRCGVLLRAQSSRRCSVTTCEATSPRAASAVGVCTTVPKTRVHAMKIRLKHAGYRRRDRLRKQVVAPMFGQIKQAQGFRQFLLRGLLQVAGEWRVVCRV